MTPYYDDGQVTIYCGDCREILPTLQADIVITDPPYGTGGWRRLESGKGSDPTASLVVEEWDDGATEWLRLIPCGTAFVFWPAARTHELLTAAKQNGLTKHRTLYMRKPDPKPQVGGRTRWSVEPIWVLSRDGFVLYGGDDVLEACQPRAGRDRDATGHPYEKPLTVMTWLIAKTKAGVILDPFSGSGTTLVAAKIMGRKAIGIEHDEQWCVKAVQRLRQSVLPLEIAS